MQQRSFILFDSAIKSPKTREPYIGYLTEFQDFFIHKSYDLLIEMDILKHTILEIQNNILEMRNKITL